MGEGEARRRCWSALLASGFPSECSVVNLCVELSAKSTQNGGEHALIFCLLLGHLAFLRNEGAPGAAGSW